MKNWYRLAGLTLLLALLSFGALSAQEYGSCYVDCGGGPFYEISFMTQAQCCFQLQQCPNGYGYFFGTYWNPSPYESLFCGS